MGAEYLPAHAQVRHFEDTVHTDEAYSLIHDHLGVSLGGLTGNVAAFGCGCSSFSRVIY